MTTGLLALGSAKDFFDEVAKPSYDEFMTTASSFRTAFNAVTALFHLHEWVYEFNRSQIEAKYSKIWTTKGDFWKFVESQVPTAGFVRDLANASKHVKLTLRPSTNAHHIANTAFQVSSGYGTGGYGEGRYAGPSLKMKDGAGYVDVDDCVKDLYAFWEPLIAELYP